MTAAELKASILDLAVRGQLVPQDPKDKPADKPSDIDDPPYELPRNWVWKRLGEVIELKSGQDLKPTEYNDKQEGVPYITGASNICNGGIVINRWTKFGRSFAIRGDLLLSCKGTVGAMAFLSEDKVHIARQIMGIRVSSACNDWYVRHFIETSVSELQRNAKSLIPGIARNDLLKLLIPLPPLVEQKRIVAKIEELLPLVEEYGEAQKELETLNADFPAALRESILQDAVQGKLTAEWRRARFKKFERFEKFETARELLDQIAAERAAVGRARPPGAPRKKENPLPPITDDEKPFEIPDTWAWCRLNDLFNFIDYRGKTPNKIASGIPLVTAKNVRPGYMDYSVKDFISKEEFLQRQSRGVSRKGDILFTTEAPLGYAAIADLECFSAGQRLITLQQYTARAFLDNRSYVIFLLAPLWQRYLYSKRTGTTVAGIKAEFLKRLLIPLPPLAEQKAIVERVDELLKIVDAMKAQ